MKYAIPALRASGGGAIVNMSSTAGLSAKGGLAAYVAAKHGVIGLTATAALDYAAHHIRINAVAPGPILTAGLSRASDAARAQVAAAVLMGRKGRSPCAMHHAPWIDRSSTQTHGTGPSPSARP